MKKVINSFYEGLCYVEFNKVNKNNSCCLGACIRCQNMWCENLVTVSSVIQKLVFILSLAEVFESIY